MADPKDLEITEPETGDKPVDGEGSVEDYWNEFERMDNLADHPDGDDGADGVTDGEDAPEDDGAETADHPPDDAQETSIKDADDGAETEVETDDEKIARLERENDELSRIRAGQDRKIGSLNKQIEAEKAKQKALSEGKAERETRKEEIAEVSEDFADVVKPLSDNLESMDKTMDAMEASSQATIDALTDERNAELSKEAAAFQSEHPDGLSVVEANIDAFNAWIEDQPKAIRDLHQQNADVIVNGKGAALIVSKFKKAIAEASGGDGSVSGGVDDPGSGKTDTGDKSLEEKRKRQLEASQPAAPGRSQKRPTSASELDTDDPEEAWEYWERIDAEKERRSA